MKDDFKKEIEKALSSYSQKEEHIIYSSDVGGGCINNGSIIETKTKEKFFVKYNYKSPAKMFECEKNGLKEINKTNAIRVPQVITSGGGNDSIPSFLILENIESGIKKNSFYEDFGIKFANMHKYQSDKWLLHSVAASETIFKQIKDSI